MIEQAQEREAEARAEAAARLAEKEMLQSQANVVAERREQEMAQERAKYETELRAVTEMRLAEERAQVEAKLREEIERKLAEDIEEVEARLNREAEKRLTEERARMKAMMKSESERRFSEERILMEARLKEVEERKQREERSIAEVEIYAADLAKKEAAIMAEQARMKDELQSLSKASQQDNGRAKNAEEVRLREREDFLAKAAVLPGNASRKAASVSPKGARQIESSKTGGSLLLDNVWPHLQDPMASNVSSQDPVHVRVVLGATGKGLAHDVDGSGANDQVGHMNGIDGLDVSLGEDIDQAEEALVSSLHRGEFVEACKMHAKLVEVLYLLNILASFELSDCKLIRSFSDRFLCRAARVETLKGGASSSLGRMGIS